jgi:hypothetical protein
MLPAQRSLETGALTPVRRLGRPLGKPDKDARSEACSARERLRTQYGAAQRAS